MNLKRLVYCDSFMDPITEAILEAYDAMRSDSAALNLPQADNGCALAQAHGYGMQARGELRGPFFTNTKLLTRRPNLSVSPTGAA